MQAEIDRFRANHDGRMPTFEDRNEFPYMISVQKECMRYRATTPFGVPHVTTKDGNAMMQLFYISRLTHLLALLQ